MAFSQAKEQAEKEILKTFAITDKISTPEKVSLTDNSKDAAILLAISSIMLYDKSEAEFSEFIAKFSNDLERDGPIDDSSIKEKIKAGQENCHPSAIKKRMEEFYEQNGSSITIGDFSAFVDFNGDGVIDDKDGETLDKVPDSIVTEDTLFATEDNVQAVISGMYVWLRDYVKGQNELDAIRLDNANVNTINPGAALVCNTWVCGYRVNSMALIVAKGLTSKSFPYDPMTYLAEANGVDNSSEWFARGHVYGTFAALRRLGAVQDKTGIDAHYNLLPIPSVELMACPKFTQNPGY